MQFSPSRSQQFSTGTHSWVWSYQWSLWNDSAFFRREATSHRRREVKDARDSCLDWEWECSPEVKFLQCSRRAARRGPQDHPEKSRRAEEAHKCHAGSTSADSFKPDAGFSHAAGGAFEDALQVTCRSCRRARCWRRLQCALASRFRSTNIQGARGSKGGKTLGAAPKSQADCSRARRHYRARHRGDLGRDGRQPNCSSLHAAERCFDIPGGTSHPRRCNGGPHILEFFEPEFVNKGSSKAGENATGPCFGSERLLLAGPSTAAQENESDQSHAKNRRRADRLRHQHDCVFGKVWRIQKSTRLSDPDVASGTLCRRCRQRKPPHGPGVSWPHNSSSRSVSSRRELVSRIPFDVAGRAALPAIHGEGNISILARKTILTAGTAGLGGCEPCLSQGDGASEQQEGRGKSRKTESAKARGPKSSTCLSQEAEVSEEAKRRGRVPLCQVDITEHGGCALDPKVNVVSLPNEATPEVFDPNMHDMIVPALHNGDAPASPSGNGAPSPGEEKSTACRPRRRGPGVNRVATQNSLSSPLPSCKPDPSSKDCNSVRPRESKYAELKRRTLSYPKWCADIVQMVFQTRTPFAAFVAKSIQLSRSDRKSHTSARTYFPIPVPRLGAFDRKTRSSSNDSKANQALAQAVHVVVMALNYWYSGGRFVEAELLQRMPSSHHVQLYDRIRCLIRSEGPAEIGNMPSAGRRFPELMARLCELTDALTKLGALNNPYEKSFAGFEAPKDDLKDACLQPYHDLNPDKMKLFGKGKWDPCPFLSDELCMAFREPRSLLFEGDVPEAPKIHDRPETVAALAHKWDELGLLFLHDEDIHPSSPVRIFGAYKDESCHRQIGDRRGQNSREACLRGPSSQLPSGVDFSELYIDPLVSQISISITDRKDFYHQLQATESKAIANTIGPAVLIELVKDTQSFSAFLMRDSRRKYDRHREGDRLRKPEEVPRAPKPEGCIWTSFKSVLQGDHTGVEVATESHTGMLQAHGLLDQQSTLVADRPLEATKMCQGLVIDDYFSVSIEPQGSDRHLSKATQCYNTAQDAYLEHQLLGSPHKDVVNADEGRVIGAYINGSKRATDLGLVTLSAPPQKRLAMSVLTLELCQLRHTTDSLHLCLVGGWVSVLCYRRPLMSLLQESYRLVDTQSFDRNNPKILPMSRSLADELTVLAVLIPLMTCELSAPYSDRIFCTDASSRRGAILETIIDPAVHEVLWKTSRSKGAYTRLLTPIETVLRRLEAYEEAPAERERPHPERPLAFSFEFLEVFSGAAKISSYIKCFGIQPGPPLDIGESPEYDLRFPRVIAWLTHLVQSRRLLGFFLGPPCTTFSIMRRPRLRDASQPYGYDPEHEQTKVGNILAPRSFQLMHVGGQCDSVGILETPYSSYMKHLPPWRRLRDHCQFEEVRTDSCRFGSPHLKSFRLLGLRVSMKSLAKRCQCSEKHVVIQGSLTKGSATYTDALACEMAKVLAEAILATRRRLQDEAALDVKGLENHLANEVMVSSRWVVKRDWTFRRESHINILEESSLLRLCQCLAKEKGPIRTTTLVDSNVVRCATAKGRTSSYGLSPVIRRVSALMVSAGIYMNIPFCPTRLNSADDPTRDCPVREPCTGLRLQNWSRQELFKLGTLARTKKWASNWVRLTILLLGPKCLEIADRSIFRIQNMRPTITNDPAPIHQEFDSTLGFPGEGPGSMPALPRLNKHKRKLTPKSCRWNLNTGPAGFPSLFGCLVLSRGCLLLLRWVLCFMYIVPAMAMPISATTPGEVRRAAERDARGPLQTGRPVTTATTAARDRHWSAFESWALETGIDLNELLLDVHRNIEGINYVLTKYGRELYAQGKSYNQYAETINSLGSKKPSIRRMLQQAWDLGYSWVKSEPSNHHIAMPTPILLAMLSTAIIWGWTRVAGCLALGFGALLRPGEITSVFRRDVLLPSDVGFTTTAVLVSIREPKSRYSYARHQTAKADSSDLVKIIEMAFQDLREGEKIWPLSPQTLRNRFRSLLQALQLPTQHHLGNRCLDLGSLRSGGATFIISVTENSELCRRRGRWASMKMMDIYIQEVMALQYMKIIEPASRELILQVAKTFSSTLDRALVYTRSKIPNDAWYALFTQWKIRVEKMGERSGQRFFFSCTAAFEDWPWQTGFDKRWILSHAAALQPCNLWLIQIQWMEKRKALGEWMSISMIPVRFFPLQALPTSAARPSLGKGSFSVALLHSKIDPGKLALTNAGFFLTQLLFSRATCDWSKYNGWKKGRRWENGYIYIYIYFTFGTEPTWRIAVSKFDTQ